MAAVVNLLSSPKISGRFYYLFAAVRNGRCAPGPGRSWKRESSSYEQESSQENMPVSMEDPYKEPPKKCVLCGVTIDYKNVQAYVQRNKKEMGRAIRRAQCMGFMSVMHKDPKFRNDPKICNIKYPE